jgi:membrane protein YdbS with pleckstrin-like domain
MSEPEIPTGPAPPTTPEVPCVEAAPPNLPQHIGRYRIERLLGQGGFGAVYLARDDQLHRPVAIKVPHRERISLPEDVEAYIAEARIVASLDHPHIVAVFDIGCTEDGLPFVVSKYVEGSDLKERIKESRPSFSESSALVATIAEALHYAHLTGLVHRDVKPSNILIDTAGKPYIADFGLALKEEDFGKGVGFGGTPIYMSPEQARGEGHRVNGRSDIFSLGVVLYELLTGRRPFRGETRDELLEQIANVEARPPRQVDDAIPKELERICLKALAKPASERYTTARDMADDLRHFLAGSAECGEPTPGEQRVVRIDGQRRVEPPAPASGFGSGQPTSAYDGSEGIGPGERVIATARISFASLFGTLIFFVAVELCVILLLFVGVWSELSEQVVRLICGLWLAVMGFVVVAFFVVRRTTAFLLTDKRILIKSGIVTTQLEGIPLTQIEAVRVDQGVLGKMFDYGTVVLKGTGGSEQECKDIETPFLFYRRVQEQMAQEPGAVVLGNRRSGHG